MPSSRFSFVVALIALALPVSMIACAESGGRATSSDDDDGGSAGGGGSTPTEVTASITPVAGGTLSDSGVTLSVPPGAVDENTEITLTVTSSAETVSDVFAFGPSGVGFTVPATLSVSTFGLTPGSGKTLALATQVDGVWNELAASAEGSALETSITSLGSFAVIEVDGVESECDATCMAQSGAVCCTECGCEAAVWCQPVCGSSYMWDCELGCCYDYELQQCAP